MLRPTPTRPARLAAACLLAACAAGPGPGPALRSGTPVDSAPMASADATILATWRQTLTGPKADIYLSAPGDPAGACHLSTTPAGISFHCEAHAGWIEVRGLDPAAPHEVAVTLMRGAGRSALAVTQTGRALPQSQASVPGAPRVPAGGRLRVQLSGEAAVENLSVRETD